MAGVTLGGQRTEGQHQVVAVRPDQAHAALELLRRTSASRLEQPGREQLPLAGRRAGDLRRSLARERGRGRRLDVGPASPCPSDDLRVRPGRRRARSRRRPGAAGRPAARRRWWPGAGPRRRACARRPAAPRPPAPADFSRALRCLSTRRSPRARRRPRLRAPRAGRRGTAGGPTGSPLTRARSSGANSTRAQHARAPPAARGTRRAVEPGPVGPARGDLELDQRRPVVARRPRARTTAAAAPNRTSGRVGGDAVAAQRGDVADGLDQVGLALPVGPDQRRDPRRQRQLRRSA